MPTKRRKVQARQVGISARAIEAWRIGDGATLHDELGLGPHQDSPFDVTRAEPPEWMPHGGPQTDLHGGAIGRAGWRHAWELRQRLLELAGPPGKFDRHGKPLGPRKHATSRAKG